MKVKTHHRTTHTLETDEGEGEVKLEFAPYYENDIMVERVGDKLIVAYLVQDNFPLNPLTDHDCQGNIYTRGRNDHSVTNDDSEVYSALGLDGENDPDIDRVFLLDGERTNLRELAVAKIKQETPPSELEDFDEDADDDEIETLAYELYTVHWRAIVGPYVVPLSYCSSNHGPGTMTVSPTSWDGDPDDLPDGVWVADKGAMENIEYPAGNHETTLAERAVAYAKSVCSEYESYCNGDVYGCVCEVFVTEGGEWEKVVDEDLEQSCWSFIGHDYAIESLKSEFFDPAVEAAKK